MKKLGIAILILAITAGAVTVPVRAARASAKSNPGGWVSVSQEGSHVRIQKGGAGGTHEFEDRLTLSPVAGVLCSGIAVIGVIMVLGARGRREDGEEARPASPLA